MSYPRTPVKWAKNKSTGFRLVTQKLLPLWILSSLKLLLLSYGFLKPLFLRMLRYFFCIDIISKFVLSILLDCKLLEKKKYVHIHMFYYCILKIMYIIIFIIIIIIIAIPLLSIVLGPQWMSWCQWILI